MRAKRWGILTVIMALCLWFLMAFAFAEDVTIIEQGSCGENLTYTLDSAGTLTISGEGAMYNYYGSNAPWYKRTDIRNIVIEDGVTTIGNYAFYECSGVESVSIPVSVTTIGHNALTSLTSAIGTYAGTACAYEEISGAPVMSYYAEHHQWDAGTVTEPGLLKYQCTGCTASYTLKYTTKDTQGKVAAITGISVSSKSGVRVEIPAEIDGYQVNLIAERAFWGVSGLTGITFPDTITQLPTSVCGSCNNLIYVDIPDGITTFGSSVFSNCNRLQTVRLPDTLTQIPYQAFHACKWLDDVVIPDLVTTIGDDAFSGCSRLHTISFGGRVTSIGSFAFQNCIKLRNVVLPDSLKTLHYNAFSGCTALETVHFSENMTAIPESAFKGCASLTSVEIPDGVVEIGQYAFSGCNVLSSVTLPSTLTRIGAEAFLNCYPLKSLEIPAKVYYVGAHAFGYEYSSPWGYEPIVGFVATVHADGVAEEYCSKNGIEHIVIKHTNDAVITKSPTCTYTGTKKITCDVCGRNTTESIPALGHSFTNYIYNNDARVGVDGTETAQCDRCYVTDTRIKTGSALPNRNPFVDVVAGKFYYEPVLWAIKNEITSGMTTTTFEPDTTCTRGQVVTFLWRASGMPEPKSTKNPFTDVTSGRYYYKAVLWAVEKGITSGMTANTFEPDSPCTRGQVVTFMWRASGKPEPKTTTNPFRDVPSGKYYSKAVLWAVENKITSGMTTTTFQPDSTCTRGQIVTFLYRRYA